MNSQNITFIEFIDLFLTYINKVNASDLNLDHNHQLTLNFFEIFNSFIIENINILIEQNKDYKPIIINLLSIVKALENLKTKNRPNMYYDLLKHELKDNLLTCKIQLSSTLIGQTKTTTMKKSMDQSLNLESF